MNIHQHVRKTSEHIVGKVPTKGNVCTCKEDQVDVSGVTVLEK